MPALPPPAPPRLRDVVVSDVWYDCVEAVLAALYITVHIVPEPTSTVKAWTPEMLMVVPSLKDWFCENVSALEPLVMLTVPVPLTRFRADVAIQASSTSLRQRWRLLARRSGAPEP